MATSTNTNNGNGGRQNHLFSPSPLLDGSPSPHMYYYNTDWGQRDDEDGNSVPLPILFAVFLGVILLLRFFCTRGVRTEMEEQDAGGGDHGTTVHQMAPQLVCTYRKADICGPEDMCGVCLADLADGEALRVLPACMHYFHAACIGEWLRSHDTCPLCRTPLVAPGAAT